MKERPRALFDYCHSVVLERQMGKVNGVVPEYLTASKTLDELYKNPADDRFKQYHATTY